MKEYKYLTDFPDLMEEFDWEANEGIDPSKITHGSSKKIWWKCSKGHRWEASVSMRTAHKTKCPYCSGRKAIQGINDLATTNPILLKEWNYEKNINIKPTEISKGSHKKVWWKCSKGHEWKAVVDSRVNGRKCPYCANKKVLQNYNDLATLFPEIAKEWDYEKNDNLTPAEVTSHSGKRVYWKCSKGHNWKTSIDERTRGRKCPYCANKKVLQGYNDLVTLFPEIAKEWDYKRNHGLKPTEIASGSIKKVYWECKNKHNWKTSIYNRTHGNGCPYCNNNVSFPEYVIEFYLKQLNLKIIHSYKDLGYELDLYIPDLKIGIEYDGYYWHKTKNKIKKDKEKNTKCKNDNITLYRIRQGIPSLNDTSIDICSSKKDLDEKSIKKLINYICPHNHLDINIKRDEYLIRKFKGYCECSNGIEINGITRNPYQWSLYFKRNSSFVHNRIEKYGLKETIKYLTKLYNKEEILPIYIYGHRGKHITIDNKTKNYKEWSLYFGLSKANVSYRIKYYGLEETVKYLTKLYEEKQSKEKDIA